MAMIEMATAFGGLMAAVVMIVSSLAVTMKWIVRKELAFLVKQIEEHDHQHRRERNQLASAFHRNGLTPPDGWNHGGNSQKPARTSN